MWELFREKLKKSHITKYYEVESNWGRTLELFSGPMRLTNPWKLRSLILLWWKKREQESEALFLPRAWVCICKGVRKALLLVILPSYGFCCTVGQFNDFWTREPIVGSYSVMHRAQDSTILKSGQCLSTPCLGPGRSTLLLQLSKYEVSVYLCA